MKMKIGSLLLSMVVVIGHAGGVLAGELSVDDVQARIDTATPEEPADFSGRDLSRLDLSGLDLSGVNLAGADLTNARLEDTRLAGANLNGANLNGTWLIGADFSNADLSGAQLFGPVVAQGLEASREQSPLFAGTDFSGARVIARLSMGDAHGADFSDARLGADMKNQSMGLMRFEAENADLSNANFAGADLSHALLRFADLRQADFTNADIRDAEFDGADLSGARFAGARAEGARFAGATLTGATGIDTAEGMIVAP